MVIAHRALRNQLFRHTVVSTDDAATLFDAGSGQVSMDETYAVVMLMSIQAQGGRQYQEDRCAVVLPEQFPSQGKDKIAFFAIYDGHGSELVSEHVNQTLHHLIAHRPELEREDWAGAIKAALIEEDQMLLDRFKNETAEPAISGSTVAVCCINLTQGELVVSNLGDSHVILAERDPKTEHPYHIVRTSPPMRGDFG
ncbi:unnamed protein product [Penicillium salamii]|uniref:protein-serine/threonine phosphatase n=1 Tax=Penicillium salamii TaxID=1612424 RepID=A0A9W4IH15_9EURO|nr:unnamed protein product [Penicillium salamii]CAG8107094.1 unnamed protein product [Penicillium salamii]CAG8282625.1 unnamed protein product [Penicillium salamii]CAG8300999.1 unnamed protein product [Penicillium salamii]CAG8385633.1 unnamed protein product [Penicillium salamii]